MEEINDIISDLNMFYLKENEIRQMLINEWREKLKKLINVKSLFKWLDEGHDYWKPNDIVEIYNTDEKNSGYSNYQHVRINNDTEHKLFMKQNEYDIKGIDHYYVWQTVGMMGDDYSGYLLFPLKNSKYFKIEYSC